MSERDPIQVFSDNCLQAAAPKPGLLLFLFLSPEVASRDQQGFSFTPVLFVDLASGAQLYSRPEGAN
jgi:hypothetical protein